MAQKHLSLVATLRFRLHTHLPVEEKNMGLVGASKVSTNNQSLYLECTYNKTYH